VVKLFFEIVIVIVIVIVIDKDNDHDHDYEKKANKKDTPCCFRGAAIFEILKFYQNETTASLF